MSSTSILASAIAVRTAFQRRSSSAVEIGVFRRSDKAMILVSPGGGLAHDVDHPLEITRDIFLHVARQRRHRAVFITLRVAAKMREDRHVLRLPQWIGR